MECNNCKLLMRLREKKENNFIFECVKCGKVEQKSEEEIISMSKDEN